MLRRIAVGGNVYSLGEEDAAKLDSYLRRVGAEHLASLILESEIPHELTKAETMQLWQAIDRVWLEEEGISGLSSDVERLRDALHTELNP